MGTLDTMPDCPQMSGQNCTSCCQPTPTAFDSCSDTYLETQAYLLHQSKALTDYACDLKAAADEQEARLDGIDTRLDGDEAAIAEKVSKAGDTMTGALDMGSNKVTQVGGPTEDGDAANKGYVDGKIAGLGTLLEFKGTVPAVDDLPMSGNKVGDVWYVEADMSGYVWVVDSTHPAGHWDAFGPMVDLNTYLKRDGSAPMTGALDMGSNKVTQVGAPTAAGDAANKGYVDTAISSGMPQATSTQIGGIHAYPAAADDTQAVKIDTASGFLYTKPTGGGAAGLQPVTVTRDSAYITQPGDTNAVKTLADPTAPQSHPIQSDQIAVYSTTNQTYRPEDVGATLLVADPHSDMEAVNKRTNDTKLAKANINDNFKRVTAVQGQNPGTESYHILAKAAAEMAEDRIPMYGPNNAIAAGKITSLGTPIAATEAANKGYVDTQDNKKLSKANINNSIDYVTAVQGQNPGTESYHQLSNTVAQIADGAVPIYTTDGAVYAKEFRACADDAYAGRVYAPTSSTIRLGSKGIEYNGSTGRLYAYGILDMQDKLIINVKDTTNATAAANVAYVNSKVASAELNGAAHLIKFKGGAKTYAIQIMSFTVSVAAWTAWGKLYESPVLILGNWQVPFKAQPKVLAITNQTAEGVWFSCFASGTAGTPTKTKIPDMHFASATQAHSTVSFTITAFGEV